MSKEKTPHKHAALIHAWADGAVIQWKSNMGWVDYATPEWNPSSEYRIKPSAPETRMSYDDMAAAYMGKGGEGTSSWHSDCARALANAAIARALADGDVVLP